MYRFDYFFLVWIYKPKASILRREYRAKFSLPVFIVSYFRPCVYYLCNQY